jgi:riboflavin synthase
LFTGIVEDTGIVADIHESNDVVAFTLESTLAESMPVGGSISVNGACLTAISVDGPTLRVEVVPETLSRTSLGRVSPGDKVNLERPMTPESLFDGHIVQGHIDGIGTVVSVAVEGGSRRIAVEVPDQLMRYIVDKGSVAVDGVSLTVAGITDSGFEVAIIPHTLEVTTLGQLEAGDPVNLEVDVLAKYVERLLNN